MGLSVFHNGSYRTVQDLSVYHNGAWRNVSGLWVYHNGAWRPVEEQIAQPGVSTLSATSVTSGGATLGGDLSGIDGYTARYRFQYRAQGTSTWSVTNYTNSTTNGTKTQSVTGLSHSTTYEYRMQAANLEDTDNVQSGNIVTFTTQALQPPTNVAIFMTGSSSTVTWTAPGGSPQSYDLQYRIGSGNWNVLASGVTTTSHDFDACFIGSDGEVLTVRVMANYSGGSSGWAESSPETISGCGGPGGF